MHFPAMLLFSCFWVLFAYAPMAHWVWGGGWMAQMGAVDFAGGAVVHMASAAAALACAQAVGPRLRSGLTGRGPHNLPMTLIGGGLLWFGWFGFNAGSALSSGSLAAHAFATTHLATAFGVAGWLLVEWIRTGKPTSLGAVSGALAGLVVITPAAGYVPFGAAMFMGLVGGMGCYAGILLKYRFHYDDALDVVGIHGIGGTIGALLTGVFACASVNGVDVLLSGAAALAVDCRGGHLGLRVRREPRHPLCGRQDGLPQGHSGRGSHRPRFERTSGTRLQPVVPPLVRSPAS